MIYKAPTSIKNQGVNYLADGKARSSSVLCSLWCLLTAALEEYKPQS